MDRTEEALYRQVGCWALFEVKAQPHGLLAAVSATILQWRGGMRCRVYAYGMDGLITPMVKYFASEGSVNQTAPQFLTPY